MFPGKVIYPIVLVLIAAIGCSSEFAWKNAKDPSPAVLGTQPSGQAVFRIDASATRVPVAGFEGSEVTFTATCLNNGPTTISWDFGTTYNETGVQIKKSFHSQGQIRVKAKCRGAVELLAESTIDVYYPGTGGNCLPSQPGCNGGTGNGPNQNGKTTYGK